MCQLKRLIDKFLKSHFCPQGELLKNSFTLFSGATIGQLIPFFAGPLLAYLYSPADFGFFALMSTTAGIASIISTGSFEYAIVSAKEEDVDDLVSLASILNILFSVIAAVIVFSILITSKSLANNNLKWVWMLVPLFIFFQGLMNTLNYRMNRQAHYGYMAKGKVMRDSVMTISQLFLGLLNVRWGLLPGVMFGQVAANGFLLGKLKGVPKINLRISFVGLRRTFLKHYRFPLFLMPSQIINELSVQIPIYFLSFFFSATVVGLYALPQKLLNVPVVLLGNSIGQVFFKDASKQMNSPENLKKTTHSLFSMLFYIGVIPFSVAMVFGDLLMCWIFGAEWQQSGVYVQYLSPWLMFVLIGSPLSRLFTVLEKQREGLWFNVVLLIIRFLGLAIGAFIFNSADIAVKLFAISGAIYWIFLSFYTLRMAKVRLLPVIANTFIIWASVVFLLYIIRCVFI